MKKGFVRQMNHRALVNLLLLLALIFTTIDRSFAKSIPNADQSGTGFRFSAMDSIMDEFMQKYEIVGAAVAVVKDEKLVYVNSYGYQDSVAKQPTTINNLFRIASISKPITLVGLLTLVNQGKLSLDDTVFGEKGVLGNDYGEVPVSSNKDKITVRHLIEHRSGWQNIPGDPMFMYKNLDQEGVIREILANRPFVTNPGEKYYYSNVSYCILGRVIEKVSGMRYADFIKKFVLKPSGIVSMSVGGNTLSQRQPHEVKYYWKEYENFTSYNMDITRMDSHGGWIASVVDLARLMVHIDRNKKVKDLLPPELLSETYMKDAKWDHSGSLPGTAAIMCRMDDTFSYVILANGRSNKKNFWKSLSDCGLNAIKLNKEWPDRDLFKKIRW
jgi:CubicO group peptidase (beta-lactamase class C family)